LCLEEVGRGGVCGGGGLRVRGDVGGLEWSGLGSV
jgi:hypothetical protein